MILNTLKIFGTLNGVSDIDLNFFEIAFNGVNGTGRIVWGFLLDKIKFKKLYGSLLIVQVTLLFKKSSL